VKKGRRSRSPAAGIAELEASMRVWVCTLSVFSLSCSLAQGEDTGAEEEATSEEGGDDAAGGEEGGDEAPATTDHCGAIEGDQTWGPEAGDHTVSCDVKLVQGTLTVQAGTVVRFAQGARLLVGAGDSTASLVATGSAAAPVVFTSASDLDRDGFWDGLSFQKNARGVSLTEVRIERAGGDKGGLEVVGTSVHLRGVSIQGSEGPGLVLGVEGRLDGDSEGLVISGNAGPPVRTRVEAVGSLPATGSAYTGNGVDEIEVDGAELTEPAQWSDLGVPISLLDGLSLEGTAERPAALTLRAGVELAFDSNQRLSMSTDGGASRLIAEGTAEAPVLLRARAADVAGSWAGLRARVGVVGEGPGDCGICLQHTRVDNGGADGGAALDLQDTVLFASDLVVEGSLGAALRLDTGAQLDPASGAVTLRASAIGLEAVPSALQGLPAGLQISENLPGGDVIELVSGAPIVDDQAWGVLPAPVNVRGDLVVEGTADAPAALTLSPGSALRFAEGCDLLISPNGGAATFVAEGSADAPITFGPLDAELPGSWGAVRFGPGASATNTLRNVVLAWGGGTARGLIHMTGGTLTLARATLYGSADWGIYTNGGTLITEFGLSYGTGALANASGDCCGG
jgi:hypothetical protein